MDRRRAYRPRKQWQPKQQWQPPRRRSRPLSLQDWLVLLVIGGAVLSQVVPELTSKGGANGRPQPLADTQAPAYYRNCDAARAAGAAPMDVGDPGYREALDRDGDGIACEPYYGR